MSEELILLTELINLLTTSRLISEEIKIDSNSSKVFVSTFLVLNVFIIFKDKKLEDLPSLFLNLDKRFMLFLLIKYHLQYLCIYKKLFSPL